MNIKFDFSSTWDGPLNLFHKTGDKVCGIENVFYLCTPQRKKRTFFERLAWNEDWEKVPIWDWLPHLNDEKKGKKKINHFILF